MDETKKNIEETQWFSRRVGKKLDFKMSLFMGHCDCGLAGSCTPLNCTGISCNYIRGVEDMNVVPVTFPEGLTNECSCHHRILTL